MQLYSILDKNSCYKENRTSEGKKIKEEDVKMVNSERK